MDRVLRNTQPTIRLDIADGNGNPLDPDPGFESLVAVSIADSAGVVVTSGLATNDPAVVGGFTFVVPVAKTAVLDVYTATWTATIGGALQTFATMFEIVGGFIVSVAEIRAFDKELADTNAYPTADLVRARQEAEDRIEIETGVAWRPRGKRWLFNGTNELDIWLPDLEPRKIVAASLDSGSGVGPVALTSTELADIKLEPSGRISRSSKGVWTIGRRNVSILYEYGLDFPPEPIKRATKILIRSIAVPSSVPDRAMSLTTGEGSFRLATAGRDGPTGIPEVDAIIDKFGKYRPVVGSPDPDSFGRSRADVRSGYTPWWRG